LPNYAAAGAVILAYHTVKVPLKAAAPVVIVPGLVFTWAIWSNVQRYSLLWKIHQIARNHWLNGESPLSDLLNNDTECKAYLATNELPAETFLPLYQLVAGSCGSVGAGMVGVHW
jgi:hypothetical protein